MHLTVDYVTVLVQFDWKTINVVLIFSDYMLSPVRLSSVTFVSPTQAVQIFRNISMALGTLAIH